jgi:phosphopantetheinyl transferase
MEDISKIRSSGRQPVIIRMPAHWADHYFQGRAVLPAVEAMQLLSHWVQKLNPQFKQFHLKQIKFEKFLNLPQINGQIEAFLDLKKQENGSLRAALMTKTKAKSAQITRTKVHAQLDFTQEKDHSIELPLDLAAALEGCCFKVAPHQIYKELVPFGPSYQNIIKPLYLTTEGALAWIAAPDLSDGQTTIPLGSPFVLDAAFHAACVWGQRYADIVAFPVGIDRRVILNPTQPGHPYISRVFPIKTDDNILVFDIWILDRKGGFLELLEGVKMRDVSGGRIHPPDWIRADGTTTLTDRFSCYCNKIVLVERDTLMPFAHRCLTDTEKRRTVNMGEKRRIGFLSARMACKRLSRKLSGHNDKTPAHKISTLHKDEIRPRCTSTDGTRSFHCSISHDRRFTLAVASIRPLGVDVEVLSQKILRGVHLFMSTTEQERMRSCGLDEIDAAIRIWSIKESVAKAMNLSLVHAWRGTEVLTIGKRQSDLKINGSQKAQAVHQQLDNHLFTLVY